MKTLFKEAHKMTKAIVAKFNDVNYRDQFKLCLNYLIEISTKTISKSNFKDIDKRTYKALYRAGLLYKKHPLSDGELLTEATIKRDLKVWSNYGKLRVYFTESIKNVEIEKAYFEIL